jgi:CDP-diacylglycerol--glycerol-3-phosphate 3-phosphatidyltransferase
MRRLIPNILTVGRGVLTVIFLAMVLYWPAVKEHQPAVSLSNPTRFIDTAFVVFLIAGLTDIIDGPIARWLGVVSKFGRIADPFFDKLLVCGAFVCFAIVGQPKLFNLTPTGLAVVHWLVAAVLILREVYVTVLRHIAEAHGINFAATVGGKIKMFLQSLAVGAVLIESAHFSSPPRPWAEWFLVFIYVVMIASTVISGVTATRRSSWQKLKQQK